MHLDDEQRVLNAMQVKANVLDSGCCGMAGAFGFEKEHYDISMQIAERNHMDRAEPRTSGQIGVERGRDKIRPEMSCHGQHEPLRPAGPGVPDPGRRRQLRRAARTG